VSLNPNPLELTSRARADLRMGMGVVLTEPGGGGAIVFSTETLTADRLATAWGLGGAPVVALTALRAATLKAQAYYGDVAQVRLAANAGIGWVRSLADPGGDQSRPLKGPLASTRDGNADLPRAAIQLCKAARLLPAALLVALPDAAALGRENGLTCLSAVDVLRLSRAPRPLTDVIDARLPLDVSDAGRLHVFRPDDGGEEHYAMEIGDPDRSRPVLTRLHSACFTGDVMGSLKCDCGPQLRSALAQMGAEGSGVLIYLNQEGRGIGLANKMRAYALQNQGFDTVEANHRLGFEDDERDFRIGADLLTKLGFSQARLLTNNPNKVAMLNRNGIAVIERVPLRVGRGAHNTAYLDTKAAKSGHLF